MVKRIANPRFIPIWIKGFTFSILTLMLLVGDVNSSLGQESVGSIQNLSMESQILAENGYESKRGLNVYLPPGYEDSEAHYPVLYMIHGNTLNEHVFLSQGFRIGLRRGVNELVDKLINDGDLPPLIIVFPNMNRSEDAETDKPHEDYLAKEIVPLIDENFRTLSDRENRLIGGHSRGAADSITIALEYPELFSLVGSMATGPVQRFQDLPRELIENHDQSEFPISLFVTVGQVDNLVLIGKTIRDWNRELDELLATTDIPYEYTEIFGDHLSILTRAINQMMEYFSSQLTAAND